MKKFKAAFGSRSSNDRGERQGDASGAAPQQPEPEPKSGASGQRLRALAGQISTSVPLPPQVVGISSLLGTNSSRTADSPRTTSTTSSAPKPPVPFLTGISRSLLGATQSVQRKVATPGPPRGYNESPQTPSAPQAPQAPQAQQGDGQNVNRSQAVPTQGDQTVNEAAAAFFALRLADQTAVSGSTITQAVSSEEPEQKSAVFCRWCDRCKEGIKYSSDSLDSLICLQCNLWICRKCRYVHTTLHSQRIQVELRQWVATSNDFDPISTCNKCSKPALARLQCKSQDCNQSLCLACFQNSISLDKFLEEHFENFPTHKESLAIHPEEWYVTEAWSQNPCECLTPKVNDSTPALSITHCERCHIPIKLSSSVYWCRPCREIWGCTQWICEQCFQKHVKDQAHQNQGHYFVKMLIKEDSTIPDVHKERIYCPTCQKWLSEADYVSHKHAISSPSDKLSAQRDLDLHWVLSSRQKDWQRISLYRYCDKVQVAKGSFQFPDEIGEKTGLSKCVQCQFRLAYNTSVTICVRGGCNHFIYCASCTLGTSPGRIIDHRHKESTYKVMLHRRLQLPLAKMSCFKCRRDYTKGLFTGIYCGHCKQFGVCWSCIAATAKGGSNELPAGLPHSSSTPNTSISMTSGLAGSLQTLQSDICPASEWVLIYEPRQTQPGAAMLAAQISKLSSFNPARQTTRQ